jgi:UDP-N-acetylmuramate dehydrogenase
MEMKMVKIEKDIDLKKYNTYGVGGNAKYFILAKEKKDLVDAFNFAREEDITFVVLGKGSNVVVSGRGYDGLVIVNDVKNIKRSGDKVEISAGSSIASVLKFSKEEGLTGLEFLAGVPGSLGGAIVGNAGCYGSEIGKVTESVEIINSEGQIENIEGKDADFGYRNSIFKRDFKGIILGATVKLSQSTSKKVSDKSADVIAKRKTKDPLGKTAGSFFKNVEVSDAPRKLIEEIKVRGIDGKIPAGKLIDAAGCKGMKVGDAEVSAHNAGFIINNGNASAEDIIELAEQVKKKVKERFGIELEPEVRYL